MDHKKEFINRSCFDIKVILIIKVGEKPGCFTCTEEFCLKKSESKTISYEDPHIESILVSSCEHGQYTETKLIAKKCGSPIDKLLNHCHHIIFLSAGQTIVVSGK